MTGIQNTEFAESNKACKRGYQGTGSANINPQQQSGVIGGEAGKQYRRGYIAYTLTRKG